MSDAKPCKVCGVVMPEFSGDPRPDEHPKHVDGCVAGLAENVTIWDQTIGCNLCDMAWWAEDATDDMTLFHTVDCILFGRRDVAAYYVNLDYAEARAGARFGVESDDRDGWRALAGRYVRLHKDEQEAYWRSLYDIAAALGLHVTEAWHASETGEARTRLILDALSERGAK